MCRHHSFKLWISYTSWEFVVTKNSYVATEVATPNSYIFCSVGKHLLSQIDF